MRTRDTLGVSPLDLLDNSKEATGDGGSRLLFKGKGEQGQRQVKEHRSGCRQRPASSILTLMSWN